MTLVTTPTPRPLRRDAADNRAALLAAARVVLNRDPDASLEAIAAQAGLSRRAVYGHFANRDELLHELVHIGAERVATALARVAHPDPVMRLALIASQLWRELESIRVMAVIALRGPLKPYTDDSLRPLRASVLGAIRDGQRAETIRPDIPADRLARLVEDAALAVLEESMRSVLDNADGQRLIIATVLGTVGLGWRDVEAFIAAHPDLAWKDHD
jgi:AcrR family transcriptional regulator